ncbi:GDSL esterase/lipase CPRD49, partial [Trifolium pratense]
SLSEKTRIIFLSNPPIDEAQLKYNIDEFGKPLRTNEICGIYSKACLELCREMKIEAIDVWSAIQKKENWRNVCFIDGVHLSTEGSEILTKEILKVIKEAEWEPSLYWKLMPVEFGEDSPYDPVLPDGISTFNVSNIPFPENVVWD